MGFWGKLFGRPKPETPGRDPRVHEEPVYDVRKIEDLTPLPESLSLVHRHEAGLMVVDLRLANLDTLQDLSVFDRVREEVETISPPEKLAVWVIPAAALDSWDSAEALQEMLDRLHAASTANQATPPAGDAVVIVGGSRPPEAVVTLLTSLGMAVYTCAVGEPLPAVSVVMPDGQVVVGMRGEPLRS